MSPRSLTFSLIGLILLSTGGAAAELSARYQEWASGPVQHLFVKEDRTAWSAIASDREAEDFIRLFWARRDPNPEAADNEFQREFERRTAWADQNFSEVTDEGTIRGSLTDRGRVFIVLGAPKRLSAPGASGAASGGDFGVGGSTVTGTGTVSSGGGPGLFGRGGDADRFGVSSEEVWIYEKDAKPDYIRERRLQVRFQTEAGTEHVVLLDGERALGLVAEGARRAIVNPDLELSDLAADPAAPSYVGNFGVWGQDGEPGADAVPALAAGPTTPMLSAGLDAGAFRAGDGAWIIPVQVSAPTVPGATALVGELADAEGSTLVSFRESEWQTAGTLSYSRVTLLVGPGSYLVRAGLVDAAGALLWAGEESVEVPADPHAFWVSELLVADQIFPLPQAQMMYEPFTWMGVSVVPRAGHAFSQGGPLWIYLHACQVGLDASGQPALDVTLEMTGATNFRGPLRISPNKAGDDCWILAQGLDLLAAQFPAGDYEMKMTVTDTVKQQSAVGEGSFTVVAP